MSCVRTEIVSASQLYRIQIHKCTPFSLCPASWTRRSRRGHKKPLRKNTTTISMLGHCQDQPHLELIFVYYALDKLLALNVFKQIIKTTVTYCASACRERVRTVCLNS